MWIFWLGVILIALGCIIFGVAIASKTLMPVPRLALGLLACVIFSMSLLAIATSYSKAGVADIAGVLYALSCLFSFISFAAIVAAFVTWKRKQKSK